MARRRGQPTKLTKPLTPGNTTADAFIDKIRLGLNQKAACDMVGISGGTLHNWRLKAARLTAQQTAGNLPNPTKEETAYIDFLSRLQRAYAEAEANRLAIITRSAQGGVVVKRTTTRTLADGKQETTLVEETLRPEWTAAAWYLERTMPAKYARRVEVTGAEGAPLVPPAQQARDLADSLRDFQLGAAAAAELEEEKTET